ncbi:MULTISPECIES: hypothetical protein [Salinibaculum]|uniref:hypothetical protein n=1 Tax=Salinibaculum TaxID=2732368 RepID=UPI0030D4AA9F
MTVADDRRGVRDTDGSGGNGSKITAHTSSPDRTVFTERGNTEGWISTDTTVPLRR